MASSQQIRRQITEQIVVALEKNVLPWRRPWTAAKNTGRPANAVSKRAYSGINPLILELHRRELGLNSRWYATFGQWKSLGCTVRKRPDHFAPGKWAARIVFYRPVENTRIDDEGELYQDRFFVLRSFSVFNADQVAGSDRWQVSALEPRYFVPSFAPADQLIAALGAEIRHEGDSAYYDRIGDFIKVPPMTQFDPAGSYYETVLHELGHWSEPRLNWDYEKAGYAMCELIAEISASFLATELGVPQVESLDNHAAYLRHWLNAMHGDAGFIFRAAAQASKVADFILAQPRQSEASISPAAIPA